MKNKIQAVKRISLIVALAALLVVILVNFLPILNIKLDGVESDYTFGAPGGHNFLGRRAIFYWWGPSIFIGGVSAFNFVAEERRLSPDLNKKFFRQFESNRRPCTVQSRLFDDIMNR